MEFIATSGNLHLEEMVAALIATGVITQDGGQMRSRCSFAWR
jgi:hypothetical protein